MNVLRQSKASRACRLWHSGSSGKAEAGNKLQACWCPVLCSGQLPVPCLCPHVVYGDLGCSLEGSHGKGWSCELVIAKLTWYPEKRENVRHTVLVPVCRAPAVTCGWCQLPMCYGVSQHCAPLSIPTLIPWVSCTPSDLPFSHTDSPSRPDPAPPASGNLISALCGSGHVCLQRLGSPKPLSPPCQALTLAAHSAVKPQHHAAPDAWGFVKGNYDSCHRKALCDSAKRC